MALSSQVLKNQSKINQTVINRSVRNVFCVVALMCSMNANATDDEYLKMIEGEAEDLTLDQSGQLDADVTEDKSSKDSETNKQWKWEGDLDGDILPGSLTQEQFAALLKDNFYGSFVFYRKLNSNDQKTVYYHYTKASPAHLDDIRQDILDHLKR